MDLEHIRHLVREGEVVYTDKFDRMVQTRAFSVAQAMEVVLQGRVVEHRRSPGRSEQVYLQGFVARGPGRDTLEVLIAVTDEPRVVFISGYWPGDPGRDRR